MEKEEKTEDIAERYGIDLRKLEKEQEKLAKQLEIKDSIDFSRVSRVGGFSNVFQQNQIVSTVVVMEDWEISEQKYFSEKVRFPYIPGFRAYRELPAMIKCFDELDDKPEVVFIPGHGISHPRLGIASHFSIATGIPSIGIAESLLDGEADGEDIKINGKIVGKIMAVKEGSRPIYVSPGNLISLKSAVELTRRFVKLPHKLPEPLHAAHKYSRDVLKEIF